MAKKKQDPSPWDAATEQQIRKAFKHQTGVELNAATLAQQLLSPAFARPDSLYGLAAHHFPRMPRDDKVTYQIVSDMLMLDGNARQNMATFVTTWMDPYADRLFAETYDKNMIDKDEYPMTAEIEARCVSMISELWNAPDLGMDPTGTSTTGSSEAVMLGGMALKRRWRKRQEAAGKPADKPNLVMGINVQVVWEKYCRYWDVEARYVPIEPGRLHLTAEEAVKYVDENTIGVVAILGSTFDGSYEPVSEICAALDQVQEEKGLDIPVHVDAASGGFVAPFIDQSLVWDFRLERVKSINASGHKYGLVYPGVGWVLWREKEDLPEELVFHVNYLGGDMPTFGLNFSRPGSQVIAQYYQFLRLGRLGYAEIQTACRNIAMFMSSEIAGMEPFELLSDGSELPVFFFKLKDRVTHYTVYDVSNKLRERGWQVPAYTLPADLTDVAGLRIVVRNGFSRQFADLLIEDLRRAIEYFEGLETDIPKDPKQRESFKH